NVRPLNKTKGCHIANFATVPWPLILTHPKVANRPEMQIGFPAFWQAGNRSDDEVERDTQNKIIT
ncbi:hypothetical protein, partial [Escherichia coli]|uniref:hypothetical protein n=1 Tax=Escherichia coli TaxID=562 RepID=UPI00385E2302